MMDFAPEVAFHLAAQPIVSAIVCRPGGHLRNPRHGWGASSGSDPKNSKRARCGVRYPRQVLPESGMDLAVS